MSNDQDRIERDIAATFFDAKSLSNAMDNILALGIERDQLGLLCSETALKEKLNSDYDIETATAEGNVAARYVKKEGVSSTVSATFGGLSIVASAIGGGVLVASAGIFGGALAVATAGSVIVSGLGAIAGSAISTSDADTIQNELDAGHIVLLVRTQEDRTKDRVIATLKEASGLDPLVLENT